MNSGVNVKKKFGGEEWALYEGRVFRTLRCRRGGNHQVKVLFGWHKKNGVSRGIKKKKYLSGKGGTVRKGDKFVVLTPFKRETGSRRHLATVGKGRMLYREKDLPTTHKKKKKKPRSGPRARRLAFGL